MEFFSLIMHEIWSNKTDLDGMEWTVGKRRLVLITVNSSICSLQYATEGGLSAYFYLETRLNRKVFQHLCGLN